jgi:hypothetical protein
VDKEAVQMFAAPIEGTLKNVVEVGDTGVAPHAVGVQTSLVCG